MPPKIYNETRFSNSPDIQWAGMSNLCEVVVAWKDLMDEGRFTFLDPDLDWVTENARQWRNHDIVTPDIELSVIQQQLEDAGRGDEDAKAVHDEVVGQYQKAIKQAVSPHTKVPRYNGPDFPASYYKPSMSADGWLKKIMNRSITGDICTSIAGFSGGEPFPVPIDIFRDVWGHINSGCWNSVTLWLRVNRVVEISDYQDHLEIIHDSIHFRRYIPCGC